MKRRAGGSCKDDSGKRGRVFVDVDGTHAQKLCSKVVAAVETAVKEHDKTPGQVQVEAGQVLGPAVVKGPHPDGEERWQLRGCAVLKRTLPAPHPLEGGERPRAEFRVVVDNLKSADGVEGKRSHVLLCSTGSVATVKAKALALKCAEFASVILATTTAAEKFITDEDEKDILGAGVGFVSDVDEWEIWRKLGDPVLHIELRKWADVIVVAPLSANSLAKLACGLSDNLVTCTARAWDFNNDPFLVAPAMNTLMWTHPLTKRHVTTLKEIGATVIPPVAKRLACNDVGVGAMAHVDDIAAQTALELHRAATAKKSSAGVGAD